MPIVCQISVDQSEDVPKVPTPPPSPKDKLNTIIDERSIQIKRPTTLVLNCNRVDATDTITTLNKQSIELTDGRPSLLKSKQLQKQLYRSNSSSLHKRSSSFVPSATTSAGQKFKLSSELDEIFVISNNNRPTNPDDENYDSIEVIDERRMKNMPKSDRARLYKSNTFICEEYYTDEQLAGVIDAETSEIIFEEKRE